MQAADAALMQHMLGNAICIAPAAAAVDYRPYATRCRRITRQAKRLQGLEVQMWGGGNCRHTNLIKNGNVVVFVLRSEMQRRMLVIVIFGDD